MLFSMSEDDFDAVVRVHLKGTFATSHHAAVYWREESKAGNQPRAAIVNTVSSAGLQGNVGQANYGAAKAGLAGLNRVLATRVPAAAPRSMPSPRSPRPA
jgi:NAD(P)-dependent dehydrogenase (short-subunit alcohol dehydrogenase family)